MSAEDVMAKRDHIASFELERIGRSIGYGNAQHILGQLWDATLQADYGIKSGRGAMGVTIDDALPPLPKPTKLRRQMRADGGYSMVPAYTAEEMKAFGHAAIAKAAGSAA